MQVLYIAGQGRSGSTLAERVLAEIPGVCALGEASHVWQEELHDRERCACGAWFSACGFWSAVGARAFGGWHNVDKQRIVDVLTAVGRTRLIPWLLRPGPDRLKMITEFATHQTQVYAAAAAVSGAPVVIDSSKYAAFAYCLRFVRELDLRVVHLVRDPRGVAYSWTKQVPRPETDGATAVPRYRPSRSALRWTGQNVAVELLARIGRGGPAPQRVPVYRLRYEDLLTDPRRAARSLARFAGLDPSPSDLDHIGDGYVDLKPIHSASGNPMRFTVGRVPLRPDEDWRTGLPVRQRRLVNAICAPVIAAYGYPLTVRPVSRQAPARRRRPG